MPRRITQLLVGLLAYGLGLAAMVRATIGVAPWDVLTQGIAIHSGWSFGLITNLVGALLLLAWIPLRQRPGVGTVLNVLLIGPAANVALALIPAVDHVAARVALFVAGLATVAVATGLYIGTHLGPGPRDGLMTGLHARTGMPVWFARTLVEVGVLAVGWLLGGNVGVGTLTFALLIGPACQRTLPLFDLGRPRRARRPALGTTPGAAAVSV
jgi:uncharacterized membrane protein YczE